MKRLITPSLLFFSFFFLFTKNWPSLPFVCRSPELSTPQTVITKEATTSPSHSETVIGTITADEIETWSDQQELQTKLASLLARTTRITEEILPEIDRIERARRAQLLSKSHGELVRAMTAIQRVRERWLDELESAQLDSLRLEQLEVSLTRENQ